MDAISGVITVTTAGTAVQGPSVDGSCFSFRALSTNSGLIYVGNDGENDVASTNGYHLAAGQYVEVHIPLAYLWFDTSNSGDKVAWLRVR